jgi:cob(I)alamin adenosyltransferase
MPLLFTRRGDDGTTGLYATKERFPKDAVIYDALGTLDELNSLLGICYARSLSEKHGALDVPLAIQTVQQRLFIVQAEVAGAQKSVLSVHVEEMEHVIHTIEEVTGDPHAFIIPGATEFSGLLDYARAVSRRAERSVTRARVSHLSPATCAYLNRLSSLLYALARYAAYVVHAKELSPSYET